MLPQCRTRPTTKRRSRRRSFCEWFAGALAYTVALSVAPAQKPVDPAAALGAAGAAVDAPTAAVFNPAAQVRMDILMVRLPEEKAVAMLPALRDPNRVAGAKQQLLGMIEHHEAELLDWPELQTLSHNRAVTETVLEERFPSEFVDWRGGWGNDLPKFTPAEKARRILESMGALPSTEYETKNVGATVEIEPEVNDDGQSATINLAIQHISLQRMDPWPAARDAWGEILSVKQPLFLTHKIATTLTFRNGDCRLLYLSVPHGPGRHILLFIATVRIIPASHPAAPAQGAKR